METREETERELRDEVAGVVHRLTGLEDRIAALEAAFAGRTAAPAAAEDDERQELASVDGARPQRDLVADFGLAGRTLMALGGGFLLRALTEGGAIPVAAGVALGFAYAAVWLALADRSARGGRGRSASAHALSAALLAFPLAWEAVVRFHALSATAAAGAVAAAGGLHLAVAAGRRLRLAAWWAALGASAVSWALIVRTGTLLPFVLVLTALGVAAVGLTGRLGGWGLAWFTAASADLAALLLAIKWAYGREPGGVVPLVLLALLALAYVATVVARSRRSGWRMSAFEVAQTGAALAIGYGGVLRFAGSLPAARVAAGLASLALATVTLLAATAVIGQRRERRPAFLLYANLGFVFVLGGSGLLLAGTARAVVWSALAVAAAGLAVRGASVSLGLQSALFAIAAGFASGLLPLAAYAFGAPAGKPWPGVAFAAGLVLLAALAAAALPHLQESPHWGRAVGLPRALLIGLAIAGGGGLLLAGLAPLVAGRAAAGAAVGMDGGALAALRTAVLAALAVAAAAMGRWRRWREGAWWSVPLLAAGAVKLLAEDFRAGRPATLFVGLALYGAALIAAPRLLRRRAAATSAPASS